MEQFEIHHINFTCSICILDIKATEAPDYQSHNTEDLTILTKLVYTQT